MGLLIPEVFILLLTDSISMLLLLTALPYAINIYRKWDLASSSQSQYSLEKRRYLLSTIVFYVFIIKIPLFLFYVYTNDKMANVLTGAMCAAGSINATVYGSKLLYMKILDIFMMSAWITMYKCNNSFETLPYTRMKYGFLTLIIFAVSVETLLAFMNFASIDPTAVVSCCSSIYSATSEGGSELMSIKPFTTFYLLAIVTLLLTISIITKRTLLTAILSIVFFFSGCLCLILFTSTYIYELPSHRCPYCILQKEYMYIGYLFYISLFISTACGISSFIYKKLMCKLPTKLLAYSLVFSLLYFCLCAYFPIRYYIINSVWL